MRGVCADETVFSLTRFLRYEWKCAEEAQVPVLCIIDMQRCSKSDILDGIRDKGFGQVCVGIYSVVRLS